MLAKLFDYLFQNQSGQLSVIGTRFVHSKVVTLIELVEPVNNNSKI